MHYAIYRRNVRACTRTTRVITRSCTPAEPTEPIPRKQEPERRRSHLIPTAVRFFPRTRRSCRCSRIIARQTNGKKKAHTNTNALPCGRSCTAVDTGGLGNTLAYPIPAKQPFLSEDKEVRARIEIPPVRAGSEPPMHQLSHTRELSDGQAADTGRETCAKLTHALLAAPHTPA